MTSLCLALETVRRQIWKPDHGHLLPRHRWDQCVSESTHRPETKGSAHQGGLSRLPARHRTRTSAAGHITMVQHGLAVSHTWSYMMPQLLFQITYISHIRYIPCILHKNPIHIHMFMCIWHGRVIIKSLLLNFKCPAAIARAYCSRHYTSLGNSFSNLKLLIYTIIFIHAITFPTNRD